MRTVVPVPRGGHLPFRAARLFLLCVSQQVFATPTRRYHGRMLIHPSHPSCATPSHKGARTHAGSGPSRVRRRLLMTCLGDPSPWPFTCVMNGRYQSIQAFVTSFGPFCNRSRKICSLTIEYQVFQFVPSINILEQFENILVTILQQISFLPLKSGGHRCME